ncbi:MAG TPA: hypothetical protein ENF60_02025, partial [Candidatus Omnitrophica bacterium]|nr:hypothetical protein [Candidatus Omnitrophota bacterium]
MIKVGPVPLDRFCARRSELQRLDKIKNDFLNGYRRNLAILGPLNIGKTSLVLKYIHHVMGRDIFPIYINLEDGFFTDNFLGSIFFFLHKFTNGEITDLSSVSETLKERFSYLKKFVDDLEEYYKRGDYTRLFHHILKLDKIIYRYLKLRCVYIIDEFFNLEKLRIGSWIKLLRENIMLNSSSLFILISSEVERAKSILHSEFSLLFGNFEILELKKLSYTEAIEFIAHRKITADRKILDNLIFLTAGYPLYLDILTDWIQDNLKTLDREGLLVTIRENVLDNKGFLYRYFQEKLKYSLPYKENREYLWFLLEVAKGNIRRRELEEKLKPGLLNCSLNGHLEKSGSFYRLKDPLFRMWLLYAYQPDVMGLRFSHKEELNIFAPGIEGMIPEIYNWDDNSHRTQIVKLLKNLLLAFNNEYVMVNDNRKIFPKFSKIIEENIFGDVLCLKCEKKKGRPWA